MSHGARPLLLEAGIGGHPPRMVFLCIPIFLGDPELREGRRRFPPQPQTLRTWYSGPLIPFGALVHAMPSALHKRRHLKFEPALKTVIFSGYVVQGGGKLLGEIMREVVEDFADWSFCSRARRSKRNAKVQVTPIQL